MTSTKVSTGQIADSAISTAKIANSAVTSDKILDGAITAAKVATGVIPAFSAVRQTVQGGPTSSGLPNFWPAATYSPTVTSLDLSTSGVSSTDPFVVSASQGFGNAAERVGISTANLTWTALTASRAAATPCYLYVDVAADGTLTTGHTVTAPVYSYTASSGTNTFNMTTMTMYTTGTTKGWRVFVGEAATGVGSVSAVVMYAYNGAYATTPAVLTLSAITSYSCNIGSPFEVKAKLICRIADAGYSIGDETDMNLYWPSAYYGGQAFSRNNSTDGAWKKCGIGMSASLPVVYHGTAANLPVGLTAGSWDTQLICTRKF